MKARRLLVTGGAGFIGSNFVHHWLGGHPDARVVVVDALTYAGNLLNLGTLRDDSRLRFVHADIRDTDRMEAVMREEEIDTVVHFAAESHVDRSIIGPDPFLETNVMGTHSLLKTARKLWIEEGRAPHGHRFHHVSTDEVYGSLDFNDPAFTEDSPYAPNSPYAASKAASDHLARAYHRTYGLDVTISNCSNNYGPFHFPEKMIPLMIVNALRGLPLPVYGDGRNVRDWLYVEDHCRGIEGILSGGTPGETYNIGGNCELANLDLVRDIAGRIDAALASDAELRRRFPDSPASRGGSAASLVRFVKDRPGHDRRYALDTEKIRRELGFSQTRGINEGLQSTLAWYLDNEHWWRSVMDNSYREWIDMQYAGRDEPARAAGEGSGAS